MAYNIIPQRGVFSTIANLINENFQRIYQQILGLGGSGEQAAEDISQLESDVSALQSGKANDADVVHKAGAETITGNKTFTGTVKLPLQNSGILVTDENGVVQSDSNTYAGAQTSGGAANKAVSIPFGQVDSTSTSTAFTATVDGITELRDGVCVYLRNGVVTSAANFTININNLGAKPVYNTMESATRVTNTFNVNYTVLLVYNSSRVTGGCWDYYYGYNSNTDVRGYDIREYYSGSKKVKTACQRYQIMFTCMDGMLLPVYSGAYSNGTSKTLTTEKFNPLGQIYYYYSTTNLSAGGSPAAGTLVSQSTYTTVDIRYSFNTGSTLTVGDDIYLVCVPQDDGSAVLHTSPIAFSLPSTEDGLIYKRLGKAYSTYAIALEQYKPCYYYKNGAINLWTGTGTQTDVSKAESSSVINIGEYDLMKINEVKGKSLVMNQRAKNPNPSTTNNTEWRAYSNGNVSIEYVDDGIKATIVNEGYGYTRGLVVNCTGIANTHKYFAIITIKPSVTHDFNFETGNKSSAITSCVANQWTKFAGIVTSSKNDTQLIVNPATSNLSVNDTFTVRFASLVDLTQMFGAGNEPTTVEEVEAILGDEYYDYNTGEVVGNNVEKLDVYDNNGNKKGSLALNLTELTGKVGERLPAGYTKLEYIESSGTQYIDTGIAVNTLVNPRIVTKFQMINSGDFDWFGTDNNSSDTIIWDIQNSSSKNNFIRWGSTAKRIFSGTASVLCFDDGMHTLDVGGVAVTEAIPIKVDGTSVGTLAANSTLSMNSSSHLLVFRGRSSGVGNAKFASFTIYSNGVSVFDGVPAKRNSDNEIGMYDLVSDTFFTNSGTGTFTAGSVVQDVTIYPNGLHGVGTAYDSLIVDEDGYARRAVKRMDSVDLGSLSWKGFTVNSLDGFYSSGLANIIKNGTATTPPNVLDKKYKGIPAVAISSTTAGLAVNDKALMVYTNGTIYVRDDDYTTAADFEAAMDGVMLYYELDTPIEYVLDTPVQCVAKVYPNGTVKQVPVMPDSTPMVMDVTYLHDNGGMIGGLMNRLDSLEPRIDDLAKGIKTISVQYGDATNIVLETEKINGKEGTVSIPAATSQAAGAMSAAQAALLEDLSNLADDIENLLASI